jgi:Ser/Thr protein kinase RdoA (MazF antagonist)
MDTSSQWIDSTPGLAVLAEILDSRYDLGELIDAELLQHNLDASYLWRTWRGVYVVRAHNHRWWSAAEIAGEMSVLSHLSGRGIRVPTPVAARNGAQLTTLEAPEGPRPLTVVEYLSGRDFLPRHDARDYGALVARLHSEMMDFELPASRRGPTIENLMQDAFDPILRQTRSGSELHDYVSDLKMRVETRIGTLGIGQFPQCFCHGDLNFANCVRTGDGALGLYDFECCGPGLRAYDLAVFRWTQKLVGLHDDVWNLFLDGYGALGDEELAAIDLLALVRQMWMIGHDARRTALQLLGTRWRRMGRPRNYDGLKRLDAEVFA